MAAADVQRVYSDVRDCVGSSNLRLNDRWTNFLRLKLRSVSLDQVNKAITFSCRISESVRVQMCLKHLVSSANFRSWI